MLDRLAAAAVTLGLLASALGGTAPAAQSAQSRDSGLVACAYPLASRTVSLAEYHKLRAEFAGSRWEDLRDAGTAYVDLAVQLRTAPGSDGYETVWFYQRLSAACARHEAKKNAT
jgi:hypothetical protein